VVFWRDWFADSRGEANVLLRTWVQLPEDNYVVVQHGPAQFVSDNWIVKQAVEVRFDHLHSDTTRNWS
tara:strand:- start:169 stop:372 length:204 start_codon:yes stop_codon:yes gene_type:complete